MNKEKLFKVTFFGLGIYDIFLGATFVLFYKSIYQFFQITPANHPGYVYLPALFIVAGGIGEMLIARNLVRNTDLAMMRLLMKLAYLGVVLYYFSKQAIPWVFVAIAAMSIVGILNNIFFLAWANSQKKA